MGSNMQYEIIHVMQNARKDYEARLVARYRDLLDNNTNMDLNLQFLKKCCMVLGFDATQVMLRDNFKQGLIMVLKKLDTKGEYCSGH